MHNAIDPLLVVILLWLADYVIRPQSVDSNPVRTGEFTSPQPLSKMERGLNDSPYSPLRSGGMKELGSIG